MEKIPIFADAFLTDESIKNITLAEINKNRLVMDELLYDSFSLKEEHERLMNSLTDERRVVYDKIILAVSIGSDFRQILPVIPHGSRQEIVDATINSSYLWSHCHLLSLTKNMRMNSGSSTNNLLEIKEFSEWLLKIGDGDLGDDVDGESIITIPD
ncbi:uncharacterized protein LOC133283883 [Gastrolobium bilobum]|uniref:uncharacterized protein LOC133283883 n=1 Tax=Gastrolobium bilobum TaxID=150636 RepID=UPI002AB0EBC6|nr:uncharacterized protein LOC133283883 [Gastrolobium bilobum]